MLPSPAAPDDPRRLPTRHAARRPARPRRSGGATHPSDGLDVPGRARDYAPPLDRCAVAVDERLSEAALGRRLVAEDPDDVLPYILPVAKRVRVEEGVPRVERGDGLDVRSRPRARPHLSPPPSRVRGVYFATSIARLSRITMTFTCPGYSSWSSISRAISCDRRTAPSSSTSEGSTMTRISRPACNA